MRKILIAIAIGATALVAAACGPSSGTAGTSAAPLESTAPSMSTAPLESPSQAMPSESPASS